MEPDQASPTTTLCSDPSLQALLRKTTGKGKAREQLERTGGHLNMTKWVQSDF